jgi:GNAT superfamily N-acetyltransferase
MIRPASQNDAQSIARLHIRAWRTAYQELVSTEFLDNLTLSDHATTWERTLASGECQTLVCHKDESVSGWICYGPGRDPGATAQAEIYALYVDPDHWRTGIGRRLVQEAESTLRREYQQLYLWVLTRNQRARTFYENLDYRNAMVTKHISWAGSILEEVRYWRPI